MFLKSWFARVLPMLAVTTTVVAASDRASAQVAAGPVAKRVLEDIVSDLVSQMTERPKPSATTIKILPSAPALSGELVVMKASDTVILEGGDSDFWGDNRAKLAVKCQLRYVINLKSVGKGSFRFDPKTGVLRVKMPPVRLENPTADLNGVEVLEKTNPLFRSSGSWHEVKDRMLKEDFKGEAMRQGQEPGRLKLAEASGRDALRQLLQHAFSSVDSKIRVEIE